MIRPRPCVSRAALSCVAALALGILAAPARAQAPGKKAGKRGPAPAAKAPKSPDPKVDVAAARSDLSCADVERAAAAAARLAQARSPAALDALLDALALGMHPRVAAAALDAVAQFRAPQALDMALYYARNRNPAVRAKAIAALGGITDKLADAAWRAAFTDGDKSVRAAAAEVATAHKDAASVDPMIALLRKGDQAMAPALAAIATPDVARRVAELIGDAPDALVAECLGAILLRTDLGKEDIYVEIVRAIGKIPGDEAVVALTAFIGATPEKPPRQSRREAQTIYEQRLGGGQ